MRLKTTSAFEAPAIGVDPGSTSWADMACSSLIEEHKANSIFSQLVGYLEPDSIKGPLVEPLIGLPSPVKFLADMGGISKDHRRDSLCLADLDKMPCYLVLSILYPVVDPFELPPFSQEQFFSPMAPSFLMTKFSSKRGLHLFPILFLGAKEPTIVDSPPLAIKGGEGMDFSRVNSDYSAIQGNRLRLGFHHQPETVAIIPNNLSAIDRRENLTFGNRNKDRWIALATGKLNMPIFDVDSRDLEGNAKIPVSPQRWSGKRIGLFVLEVALEGSKVFLNYRLGSLGVELIRPDDLLHLGGLEPDALLVMDFVDIGDSLGIDAPALSSQGIQLLAFIQFDGDGAIHLYPRLSFNIFTDGLIRHIPAVETK